MRSRKTQRETPESDLAGRQQPYQRNRTFITLTSRDWQMDNVSTNKMWSIATLCVSFLPTPTHSTPCCVPPVIDQHCTRHPAWQPPTGPCNVQGKRHAPKGNDATDLGSEGGLATPKKRGSTDTVIGRWTIYDDSTAGKSIQSWHTRHVQHNTAKSHTAGPQRFSADQQSEPSCPHAAAPAPQSVRCAGP